MLGRGHQPHEAKWSRTQTNSKFGLPMLFARRSTSHQSLAASISQPSVARPPSFADFFAQSDTTKHRNSQLPEIVNDVAESIHESSLAHLFHEDVPLHEMTFCKTCCKHFKVICWYVCLSIRKGSLDSFE